MRPALGDREGDGRHRDGDRDDAAEGRGRGDREGGDERRGDGRRRDRDAGEGRGDSAELRRLVRRLLERVEKLEVRLRKLEERNAALRKALRAD
jgi:hypothetical protein